MNKKNSIKYLGLFLVCIGIGLLVSGAFLPAIIFILLAFLLLNKRKEVNK